MVTCSVLVSAFTEIPSLWCLSHDAGMARWRENRGFRDCSDGLCGYWIFDRKSCDAREPGCAMYRYMTPTSVAIADTIVPDDLNART